MFGSDTSRGAIARALRQPTVNALSRPTSYVYFHPNRHNQRYSLKCNCHRLSVVDILMILLVKR